MPRPVFEPRSGRGAADGGPHALTMPSRGADAYRADQRVAGCDRAGLMREIGPWCPAAEVERVRVAACDRPSGLMCRCARSRARLSRSQTRRRRRWRVVSRRRRVARARACRGGGRGCVTSRMRWGGGRSGVARRALRRVLARLSIGLRLLRGGRPCSTRRVGLAVARPVSTGRAGSTKSDAGERNVPIVPALECRARATRS